MTGWAPPVCPIDAAHGRLLAWPGADTAWHCSHQAHDGLRERPGTPSFFRTDLTPVLRSRAGK